MAGAGAERHRSLPPHEPCSIEMEHDGKGRRTQRRVTSRAGARIGKEHPPQRHRGTEKIRRKSIHHGKHGAHGGGLGKQHPPQKDSSGRVVAASERQKTRPSTALRAGSGQNQEGRMGHPRQDDLLFAESRGGSSAARAEALGEECRPRGTPVFYHMLSQR